MEIPLSLRTFPSHCSPLNACIKEEFIGECKEGGCYAEGTCLKDVNSE